MEINGDGLNDVRVGGKREVQAGSGAIISVKQNVIYRFAGSGAIVNIKQNVRFVGSGAIISVGQNVE